MGGHLDFLALQWCFATSTDSAQLKPKWFPLEVQLIIEYLLEEGSQEHRGLNFCPF